jgi:hypothetical protein
MAAITPITAITSNKKKSIKHVLLDVVEETTSNDLFTVAYRPYTQSEFIPCALIPMIMEHHFPSAAHLYAFSDTHVLYKIKIKDLLTGPVKNWEYNRPPDLGRCPDIARYIYNSKSVIDTMFYASFNNRKETFEILDGIHRLTALKIIAEENMKPADLLTGGEFGSNSDANWLYEQYVIVNIRFNASLGTLIEIFKTLNKSQTVPDLYIKDQAREKREIIDMIANEWFGRYKKHFSSSASPNLGNTNRNRFVELLDNLYDKNGIDETCPNKLRTLLDKMNQFVAQNIPVKATADMRLKCRESGCYLFLYKNEKLSNFSYLK